MIVILIIIIIFFFWENLYYMGKGKITYWFNVIN